MSDDVSILNRLQITLADRFHHRPAGSYTTTLFAGGADAIGAKLCEESQELAEAIGSTDPEGQRAVIHEAADVVYHLMVALQYRQVTWQDVAAELQRREGTSGLEEKRSRDAL